MAITPIDIQQHRFKSRPCGYDKSGVDHFLELVSEEVERLYKGNQELKEELARTRSSLEEMRGRETMLKETLLTAQKMTDDLKNNARREGEILIADAQLRAERTVRDAEDRRVQLINDIQEIKRQKISFETSLRSLVECHMRLLDLEVVTMERSGAKELHYDERLPFEEGLRETDDGDDLQLEDG
jgi:cell division initiation protein